MLKQFLSKLGWYPKCGRAFFIDRLAPVFIVLAYVFTKVGYILYRESGSLHVKTQLNTIHRLSPISRPMISIQYSTILYQSFLETQAAHCMKKGSFSTTFERQSGLVSFTYLGAIFKRTPVTDPELTENHCSDNHVI